MADRVTVSNTSSSSNLDYTVLTDEVTEATLGTGHAAYAKIMDGAINGTNKLSISSGGAALVDGTATTQPVSGSLSIAPTTSTGLSIYRTIDLDETEEEAKATAGQVYGYYFANLATGWRYVKFYNATAANTTVGTTTPILTLPLPAQSAANVSLPYGITFATALSIAATTGLADNDTGAPGLNEVVFNLFYK